MSSELGGVKMRKKGKFVGDRRDYSVDESTVMTWGTSWMSYSRVYGQCPSRIGSVRSTGWLRCECPLYRASDHADTQLREQFGGISVLGLIFAVLFVPELKGRSLKETDELFEQRFWAWQFNDYKTTGVGRKIAQLEAGLGFDAPSDAERLGDGLREGGRKLDEKDGRSD
jgi:hypothetical protein